MSDGPPPPGPRPGARVLGSHGTAALAVIVAALAIAIVAVDLDEEGLVERPPQRAPTRGTAARADDAATAPPHISPPAREAKWPATPEGIERALATFREDLGACHAAWTTGDPTAPRRATATLRLAPGTDHLARAVSVTLDPRPAGAAEACVFSVLEGIALTEPPVGHLDVRFAIPLDEPP